MSEPGGSDQTVAALLDRLPGATLWVVGDLMLDEYVAGAVERISPEAPVPVVHVRETEYRLGGAANVARQAAVLGAHVSLAGVVGHDEAGARLLELAAAAGIDTRAVQVLEGRRTTRKLRVLGHHQQLVRLDWEDPRPLTPECESQLIERLRAGPPADALVVSDYAKGVVGCTLTGELTRVRGAAPVVVDPKHPDFTRYSGATTLTPNLKELEAAAGRRLDAHDVAGLVAATRPLARAAQLESIVVTLGERGMLIVPAEGAELLVPAFSRDVYDVTGAGDTAVAVLALALARHASLEAAVRLANAAAGVAVGQVGAVAVDAQALRDALAALPERKILTRAELAARAASWRVAGRRIVFTNGCFDLLHSGHLALLQSAARLGDVLVLAINSDASVRRLKGTDRPLVPQAERAALLAALTFVDAVTVFDEDTPLETLESVRPHVLVKGGDYRPDQVVGRELVEASGGRVELVPLVPDKSTSALVERIRRSVR